MSDHLTLAADLDRVAAQHARLAAEAASLARRVRGLDKMGDALDALQRGEFLTTRQAATICEVSDQTIINWIDHSISIGRPIAEKRASWIISASRLFDYLEQNCGGRPNRVKVENLLRDHWLRWSQAPELAKDAKARGSANWSGRP